MISPAQKLIVKAWFRISQAWQEDELDYAPYSPPDDDPYSPIDYAVANQLGLPVERVGEALVAAGKRPARWWT